MDNYEIVLEHFVKSEKPVSAAQIVTSIELERKEVNKIMTRLKKKEK